MTLRIGFFVVLVGCVWGGIATYNPGKKYTLKVVANGSPIDEDYHGVRELKRYIEEETQGRISVEIFPFGEFCSNPRECVNFLKEGILDVFMTTAGGLDDVFPPAQVIDIPHIFASNDVAECVLDGPFVEDLKTAILETEVGLRLMVIGDTGGWRSIATVERPVETPADLEGIKIRTTAGEMGQVIARQMGTSPTPISWTELYVSMATGVVDGTLNSVSDIVSGNLHEQIKYLTLDEHTYMGAFWWFSEYRWSRLDESDRRIVSEAYERLKVKTREVAKANEERAMKQFLESGGQIITLDAREKAAFQKASEGVREWFVDEFGDTWVKKLESAIAACE